MELQEALSHISEIRVQMARAGMFRGYRAATVAATGGLGLAAAGLQMILVPNPEMQIAAYLTVWVGTALLCVTVIGVHMFLRSRSMSLALSREMTWIAIEQLLPALIAGCLLTGVLALTVREAVWMLPGLWQMLFSLGIFASCRFLPRATFGVGVFYLGTALLCLLYARGEAALAPWAMGLPFGVGQLLSAAVLYFGLERNHAG